MKRIILAALMAVTLSPAAHAADIGTGRDTCGAYTIDYVYSEDTIQTLIAINGVPWRMVTYTESPSGYVQKMYLTRGARQALIDGGNIGGDKKYLSFYDVDGKRTVAPVNCKSVDGAVLSTPRHYISEDFVK